MLKLFGKLIFSALCLFCIFYLGKVNVKDILHNIAKVNLIWLVMSYIMLIVVFVIGAMRWKVLLNIESKVLSLGALIKYYFIGGFFNTFLPSSIGGDMVRVYYLKESEINIKTGLSSVVIERLLGVSALILLAALSLLIQMFRYAEIDISLILYVSSVLVIFCIVWVFYFNMDKLRNVGRILLGLLPENLCAKFKAVIEAFELIGKPRSKLFKGFVFSFIAHFFTILSVYCIALSLEIQLDIIYFMIFVPLIAMISMVPLSISGLGIRESGYVFFLVPLGIAADRALALSIVFYFMVILIGLIGAMFYSFSGVKFKKLNET